MKNSIIISVLLAVVSFTFAQNEKIGLGVKAGILIPFNKYSDDVSNTGTYVGGMYWRGDYSMTVKADFTAGIFYRYSKSKFYMMAEAMISRRGAAMKGEPQGITFGGYTTGGITQKRFAHQYFADLNVLPGVKVKRFVFAGGPSFAINLKNTDVTKFKEELGNFFTGEPAGKKFKSDFDADPIDVGILVSFGYLLPLGKTSLLFEVRFSQYFMDSDLTERLRSLAFTTGFIF